MDNPYWKAEPKPHYLDREFARVQCFDVFNIISASQALAGEAEAAQADGDGAEPSALFQLHHRLAEPRLSQLLLGLAVFVRTFDDLMGDSDLADAYNEHAANTDGVDFIGSINGQSMSLREACNKIIHAIDFRPVYDHAGEEPVVWFMSGEIELEGAQGDRAWQAVLYAPQFLETVLDRISFAD